MEIQQAQPLSYYGAFFVNGPQMLVFMIATTKKREVVSQSIKRRCFEPSSHDDFFYIGTII
jgi:hypothetical protein